MGRIVSYLLSTKMSKTASASHIFLGLTSPPAIWRISEWQTLSAPVTLFFTNSFENHSNWRKDRYHLLSPYCKNKLILPNGNYYPGSYLRSWCILQLDPFFIKHLIRYCKHFSHPITTDHYKVSVTLKRKWVNNNGIIVYDNFYC